MYVITQNIVKALYNTCEVPVTNMVTAPSSEAISEEIKAKRICTLDV
jgi:hypothetical protein